MITNRFSLRKRRSLATIAGSFVFFGLVLTAWLSGQTQDTGATLLRQAQDAQDIQKSCHTFVQSFYDWYAQRPGLPRALRYRPLAFSPEIYRALKEDEEAQAKAPGEIVGLDFDPFLNSQDPIEHYVVGRIRLKGDDSCWAEVHAGLAGAKSKESYVAAELANSDGRWHFVNFQYSSANSDFSASVSTGGLLTLLKELREAREKAAKAPSGAQSSPKPQNSVPAPKRPKPVTEPSPRN